jgi:uncharacterized membrane protein (UPF0127 family)
MYGLAASLAAIFAPLLFIHSLQPTQFSSNASSNASFTFNNRTYNFTYVAVTEQQQEQGLMNKSVNASTFELFKFSSPGIYPFWMKNTYYPLDMIWVYNSTVVYIANATPCVWHSKDQTNCTVYVPNSIADSVIESESGFVNRTGLRVGDEVNIK